MWERASVSKNRSGSSLYTKHLIDCIANSVRIRLNFPSFPLHLSRCHKCAVILVVNVREIRIRANSACKRNIEQTAVASILVAEPLAPLILKTKLATACIVAASLRGVGRVPYQPRQQRTYYLPSVSPLTKQDCYEESLHEHPQANCI